MKYSVIILLCFYASFAFGWGTSSNEKNRVRLQDVQVLTLHQGKMTTGRRSSPVPQLNCVGGSAKGMFNPQVVQCSNRGWDGLDVQWECKADMDMDYRFGSINVICEGYDYPEDPYILAGSCGLEYTLELTESGRQKRNTGYNSYNYDSYTGNSENTRYSENKWKGLSDLIIFGVVCIVIYAMYKTCIDTQDMSDRQYSSTNNDGYPGGAGGWSHPGGGSSSYHQSPGAGPGYGGDASCGAGARGRQPGTGAGGGGFWTGAGVGGLLGYMFGNRNNTGYGRYNRGYNNPYYGTGTGWGNSWGGWGGGGGGGATYRRSAGGSASAGSSGTRTASGFGGTSRR